MAANGNDRFAEHFTAAGKWQFAGGNSLCGHLCRVNRVASATSRRGLTMNVASRPLVIALALLGSAACADEPASAQLAAAKKRFAAAADSGAAGKEIVSIL